MIIKLISCSKRSGRSGRERSELFAEIFGNHLLLESPGRSRTERRQLICNIIKYSEIQGCGVIKFLRNLSFYETFFDLFMNGLMQNPLVRNLFRQLLEKRLLRNLWYETISTVARKKFITKPFLVVGDEVFYNTLRTKPRSVFPSICFLRNHFCGTFISTFRKWFRRTPQFLRNQRRFRECIEVKNLFKFRKKPFFFRV